MRHAVVLLVGALVLVGLILGFSALYVVTEIDQVVITRFGAPVRAVDEPGLHLKTPFVDRVHRFDRRWLEWDGDPNQIPTRDKKYIWVDTYGRWRIGDPLLFYQRLRDEPGAQSRLDDIIDGATRNAIASYDLIEVVRTSGRPFELTEEMKAIVDDQEDFQIEFGRERIAEEILEKAAAVMPEYGIELVDVRFKRIDYIDTVREKVYDRMISERKRIAEQYRSEGQGQSAEIRGQMERELRRIRSEAFRTSQELEGEADAKATTIYADAYSRDPAFYAFVKTLETWEKTMDDGTRIVLSTDSELYRYLKEPR
jgi:membrane protease subunit HflC